MARVLFRCSGRAVYDEAFDIRLPKVQRAMFEMCVSAYAGWDWIGPYRQRKDNQTERGAPVPARPRLGVIRKELNFQPRCVADRC